VTEGPRPSSEKPTVAGKSAAREVARDEAIASFAAPSTQSSLARVSLLQSPARRARHVDFKAVKLNDLLNDLTIDEKQHRRAERQAAIRDGDNQGDVDAVDELFAALERGKLVGVAL
jgi:hypothetical protein